MKKTIAGTDNMEGGYNHNTIEGCIKATEKIWKWTLWFLVLATSILGLMWWKWR